MIDIPLWIWLQALVQGITEFLPISSTGHLGLSWALLEGFGFEIPSEQQQQVLDIALHVGTLGAVIAYFFGDLVRVAAGGIALFTSDQSRPDPRSLLFVRLVVASVPAFLIGILITEFRELYKNDMALIAFTTLAFGVLLWIADRFFWSTKKMRHMSLLGAFFIGLMQCLAFIPGVSRSGITITAARFLGLERVEATRFSMLLSVPLILGIGTFATINLIQNGEFALAWDALIAAILAFLIALAAIHVLMELSKRASFLPFVLYRLALGTLIYLALIFDWLPQGAT